MYVTVVVQVASAVRPGSDRCAILAKGIEVGWDRVKHLQRRDQSTVGNRIAETTELSRKQVASVFDALSGLIKKNVGKKGPGMFVVPGLMKIVVIQKPATKARKGINPFTKQEQMFKAKPARKVIKVRPMKALKDMAK